MFYSSYRINHVREKHKVNHILQSSGVNAAKAYAQTYAVENHLTARLNRMATKAQQKAAA
jgi:hypothetical protein